MADSVRPREHLGRFRRSDVAEAVQRHAVALIETLRDSERGLGIAGDRGRAHAVDERGGAARRVELGERTQDLDLEAECGENRGRAGGQRLERAAGETSRQFVVELGEIPGRGRFPELPQSPDRVERHRRQRIPEHPDQRVVCAGGTDRSQGDRDADPQRFVPYALQLLEQRIQCGRIAQPGERLHNRGPFRRAVGIAEARKQRCHRLLHAGVAECPDRAKAIWRVVAGEQAGQQCHGLRPGEPAERVDRDVSHQWFRIGPERLNDEVQACAAPESAEGGDAVPAYFLPRFLLQAAPEHGQRPRVGQWAERGVCGGAHAMARLRPPEKRDQRCRASCFPPETEGLRSPFPDPGRLVAQRRHKCLEGNRPVLPAVCPGCSRSAEEHGAEEEWYRNSAAWRDHRPLVVRHPVAGRRMLSSIGSRAYRPVQSGR